MTPLQRLLRLVDRDLQHLQDHRLVGAEHLAGRDPEQQAVADLAGGAGDGDSNGGFHGCGGLLAMGPGRSVLPTGRRIVDRAGKTIEAGAAAATAGECEMIAKAPRRCQTGLMSYIRHRLARRRDLCYKSLSNHEARPGISRLPAALPADQGADHAEPGVRRVAPGRADSERDRSGQPLQRQPGHGAQGCRRARRRANLLVRQQGTGTFVASHAEERSQFPFLRITPDRGRPQGADGPAPGSQAGARMRLRPGCWA